MNLLGMHLLVTVVSIALLYHLVTKDARFQTTRAEFLFVSFLCVLPFVNIIMLVHILIVYAAKWYKDSKFRQWMNELL